MFISKLALLTPLAACWPGVMQVDSVMKRSGRLNTGTLHPKPPFDAKLQFVNVTAGSGHEWMAPAADHLRGECPGLNAAANHGFLPRDGRPTIDQTITGLGDAYNMSPDLAAFLAALAVVLVGDIPTTTWSIGGGFNSSIPLLLSNPTGLLGSHSRLEGDASMTRGDAHLNNGDVNVFQRWKWQNIVDIIGDGLTLEKAVELDHINTKHSVENNPYYFSDPLGGIVAPAAYNFVINFMSNHSAEVPGGFLTLDVLKTFFAITGDRDDFVHHKGMERIPENWYRRPGGLDQYTLLDTFADLIAGAAERPNTLQFGGNTGSPNSFTGLSLANLTEGIFDSATLLEGNNLACFVYQLGIVVGVDELNGVFDLLEHILAPVLDLLKAPFEALECPQLKEFNGHALQLFPGYKGKQ